MQLRAGTHRPTVLSRASEDLDDASHRIRSVQHTHRPAHHLDAVDVVGRQMREIDAAAGVVQRDAIEQHLHVIALAPAHEQRRLPAVAPRLDDVRTRNGLEGVGHGTNALRHEIRSPQNGHRGRDEVRRHRYARGGHDDRLKHNSVLRLL